MDSSLIVRLLAEYAKEASITRPEVALIVGTTPGTIAGIHNRNKKEIGDWPQLDKQRKKNRGCQFPVGVPGTAKFSVCGTPLSLNHTLLCEEHEGKQWQCAEAASS